MKSSSSSSLALDAAAGNDSSSSLQPRFRLELQASKVPGDRASKVENLLFSKFFEQVVAPQRFLKIFFTLFLILQISVFLGGLSNLARTRLTMAVSSSVHSHLLGSLLPPTHDPGGLDKT